MKTLTIKIKNQKALKLLRDLEDLSIIQIVRDKSDQLPSFSKKSEDPDNLYGTSIERLLAASDDDDDYTDISVLDSNPHYKNDKTR